MTLGRRAALAGLWTLAAAITLVGFGVAAVSGVCWDECDTQPEQLVLIPAAIVTLAWAVLTPAVALHARTGGPRRRIYAPAPALAGAALVVYALAVGAAVVFAAPDVISGDGAWACLWAMAAAGWWLLARVLAHRIARVSG